MLLSAQIKELEELKVGDYLLDRQDRVINKVLVVLAPGIYILSKDDDYEAPYTGSFYSVQDLIGHRCVKITDLEKSEKFCAQNKGDC